MDPKMDPEVDTTEDSKLESKMDSAVDSKMNPKMDLITVNNFLVDLRKDVARAKVQVINKLVR
jgi:hypothetical protein